MGNLCDFPGKSLQVSHNKGKNSLTLPNKVRGTSVLGGSVSKFYTVYHGDFAIILSSENPCKFYYVRQL